MVLTVWALHCPQVKGLHILQNQFRKCKLINFRQPSQGCWESLKTIHPHPHPHLPMWDLSLTWCIYRDKSNEVLTSPVLLQGTGEDAGNSHHFRRVQMMTRSSQILILWKLAETLSLWAVESALHYESCWRELFSTGEKGASSLLKKQCRGWRQEEKCVASNTFQEEFSEAEWNLGSVQNVTGASPLKEYNRPVMTTAELMSATKSQSHRQTGHWFSPDLELEWKLLQYRWHCVSLSNRSLHPPCMLQDLLLHMPTWHKVTGLSGNMLWLFII